MITRWWGKQGRRGRGRAVRDGVVILAKDNDRANYDDEGDNETREDERG